MMEGKERSRLSLLWQSSSEADVYGRSELNSLEVCWGERTLRCCCCCCCWYVLLCVRGFKFESP